MAKLNRKSEVSLLTTVEACKSCVDSGRTVGVIFVHLVYIFLAGW